MDFIRRTENWTELELFVNPVEQHLGTVIAATAVVLFVALELLFLHCVFWLGQHVYTGTCLHANDTQTAGSLTAAREIFNFHFCFWSSLHIDILLAVEA